MKDSQKNRLKFHMRLRVYREEKDFGPGVSSLMRIVREKGSLTAACREMNMAYSKAWKIVSRAEADLGFALMEGSRGGKSGGRTVLTKEGEAFLEKYTAFEERVQREAEEIFGQIFADPRFENR